VEWARGAHSSPNFVLSRAPYQTETEVPHGRQIVNARFQLPRTYFLTTPYFLKISSVLLTGSASTVCPLPVVVAALKNEL
jgi:hypothetical protein